MMKHDFKWYRKLVGGHWERWWVDAPFSTHVWLQQNSCMAHRPPLGMICDECEDYHPKHTSNHPYR